MAMAYRPTAGPLDCECNSGAMELENGWGFRWSLSWRTCAQYVIFVSNDLHTGPWDSSDHHPYIHLSDSRGDSHNRLPYRFRFRFRCESGQVKPGFGQSQQF